MESMTPPGRADVPAPASGKRRGWKVVSWGLGVAVLAALVLYGFLPSDGDPRLRTSTDPDAPPAAFERVASMAPSLTETMFALGAGDRLVGVSQPCRYPEAAGALPSVGTYMEPDYEALIRLAPDVVLVLDEHRPAFPRFDRLGLRYVVFDHRTLAGLLASFDRLGAWTGASEAASVLRQRMTAGMDADDSNDTPDTTTPAVPVGTPPSTPSPSPSTGSGKREGARRPRVLLVVGRDYDAERPRGVCVVGPGSLHDDVLRAAGGANAYAGPLAFAMLDEEALLAAAPDGVVELIDDTPGRPDDASARRTWARLPGWPTVPVRVVRGDAAFVPGPRTADFRDALAEALRAVRHGRPMASE